jgi:hypothetical protein
MKELYCTPKSQYTTVKHNKQLFEHTYTSDLTGTGTLIPIETSPSLIVVCVIMLIVDRPSISIVALLRKHNNVVVSHVTQQCSSYVAKETSHVTIFYNMNKVGFFFKNPFHKLSGQEKLVKQSGPDHPSFTIMQKHKTQS